MTEAVKRFESDYPDEATLLQAFYRGGYHPRIRIPHMTDRKPGRNDPCPCGSGKKFKRCCIK